MDDGVWRRAVAGQVRVRGGGAWLDEVGGGDTDG